MRVIGWTVDKKTEEVKNVDAPKKVASTSSDKVEKKSTKK